MLFQLEQSTHAPCSCPAGQESIRLSACFVHIWAREMLFLQVKSGQWLAILDHVA